MNAVDSLRPPAPFRIRRIPNDVDLAVYAAIRTAVTPEDPASVDDMRWGDATYPPGAGRFLAVLGDRHVGAASAGRVFVYPAEYPDFWGAITVLPEARRQGIGHALLVAISRHARDAGKTGLTMRVSADRPEGVTFLEHRGFRETERAAMVRLELAGLVAPDPAPPPGIVLTSFAERPDLAAGIHAVALEAFADIPTEDEPLVVGDLDEFRARDLDRPGIPPDGLSIAIDEMNGEVVGYASLIFLPGSTTVAWHDMTAVRRAWRGRGIAGALKRATIAWAIANGLTGLETGNDLDNAPMRAVNRRLGYASLPDELLFRGRLVPGP